MRMLQKLVMAALMALGCAAGGCEAEKPKYGVETSLSLPGPKRQAWAVAPIINLSGATPC